MENSRFAPLDRFLLFCLAMQDDKAVARVLHGGWVSVNGLPAQNPLQPVVVGDAVEIRAGCPGISDGGLLAFVATPGVVAGALSVDGAWSSAPGRRAIERIAARVARV